MATDSLSNVTLTTKANVYFDGKCVSHSFTTPQGEKKSVGVVLAATLNFGTAVAEIMECVAGECRYRLQGGADWVAVQAGESFEVPANSSFDIEVAEAFHYICHYA
mgnify:CR=1 FL=1